MTTFTQPLYRYLAQICDAAITCKNNGWKDSEAEHIERACTLVENLMPYGGGFDNGTSLDFDASHQNRLVFTTAFHHMTDGYYDGWTEHDVSVSASLRDGIKVVVHGRDRDDIKDYIAEVFDYALRVKIDAEGNPHDAA
jgi:hypothetical protein